MVENYFLTDAELEEVIEPMPCVCGSIPKERIGDGYPIVLCGIELTRHIGTYLVCPNCGIRTNAYWTPLGAYIEWRNIIKSMHKTEGE